MFVPACPHCRARWMAWPLPPHVNPDRVCYRREGHPGDPRCRETKWKTCRESSVPTASVRRLTLSRRITRSSGSRSPVPVSRYRGDLTRALLDISPVSLMAAEVV
jgi:hypothetical protein